MATFGFYTNRIRHYLREVKRGLEDLTYQDWVSRLAVVVGAIGVVVIGVLLVEALFRLFVLVIILVALWARREVLVAASCNDDCCTTKRRE
jgi:undecaprenyl pyrophosphate phosphatase UppP